jgi:anti-sigma B factor antagonist
MIFREKIEQGVAILGMSGSMLSETDAVRFRDRFHDLAKSHTRHIIIDFSEVNHINSVGLGALVSAVATVRRAKGDIRLAQLAENVLDVFTVTRLVQIFEIYDSVDQAFVKSVRESKKSA